MAVLRQVDVLVRYGVAVILASRIQQGLVRERAMGPDLFLEASESLDRAGGKSVFYRGGSRERLKKVRNKQGERFPRLRISGTYVPPFSTSYSTAELDEPASLVNQAGPDVLWVGLGPPKQEKSILANRDRLLVPLCGPVGAGFAYFAGNVPMPPKRVERAGLHWPYRLTNNPRQLWRRNLDSPLCLARVIAELLLGTGSVLPPVPPQSTP